MKCVTDRVPERCPEHDAAQSCRELVSWIVLPMRPAAQSRRPLFAISTFWCDDVGRISVRIGEEFLSSLPDRYVRSAVDIVRAFRSEWCGRRGPTIPSLRRTAAPAQATSWSASGRRRSWRCEIASGRRRDWILTAGRRSVVTLLFRSRLSPESEDQGQMSADAPWNAGHIVCVTGLCGFGLPVAEARQKSVMASDNARSSAFAWIGGAFVAEHEIGVDHESLVAEPPPAPHSNE